MPLVVTPRMMACRVARSALLSGVPSGQALGSGAALGTGKPSLGSVGRLQSLPVRASDMSAASFQVLETLLSQAHKVSPCPSLPLKCLTIKVMQRLQSLYVRVGI